jgi:hypothetical protein
MNIYVKLTKIIYLLLLACFFQLEMPDCGRDQALTPSVVLDRLEDKAEMTCLFTDILCNDIEEAEEAEEGDYKKLRKNGKQKNIRLPQLLPALSPSLCFNHPKDQSDFTPLRHNCALQSVILLL